MRGFATTWQPFPPVSYAPKTRRRRIIAPVSHPVIGENTTLNKNLLLLSGAAQSFEANATRNSL